MNLRRRLNNWINEAFGLEADHFSLKPANTALKIRYALAEAIYQFFQFTPFRVACSTLTFCHRVSVCAKMRSR